MLKKIILLNLVILFLSVSVFAEQSTLSKATKYYYLNYITPKEFKYLTSKLIPSILLDVNDEFKLVVLTDTVENINIFEIR